MSPKALLAVGTSHRQLVQPHPGRQVGRMHSGSSCKIELSYCAATTLTNTAHTGSRQRGCLPEYTGVGSPPATALGHPLQSGRELMVGPCHVHRGLPATLQMPYPSLCREQPPCFPLGRG